jgi:hypothetical protein
MKPNCLEFETNPPGGQLDEQLNSLATFYSFKSLVENDATVL